MPYALCPAPYALRPAPSAIAISEGGFCIKKPDAFQHRVS